MNTNETMCGNCRKDPCECKKTNGSAVALSDGLCVKCIKGKRNELYILLEIRQNLNNGIETRDAIRVGLAMKMMDDWIDELESA